MSDPFGFGFFPFGFAAFGSLGEVRFPPTYVAPNGLPSVRAIVNGDYVLADDGTYLGADPIGQEVLARVATIKGTFVDAAFGDSLTTIRIRTAASATEAQNYIQAALQPMVDATLIANLSIQSTFVNNDGTVVSENVITYNPVNVVGSLTE
jgi:hypothetical protein